MTTFFFTQIPFYILSLLLAEAFVRKLRFFWAVMTIFLGLIAALCSVAVAHFAEDHVSAEVWPTLRDALIIISCFMSSAGALALWRIRLSVLATEHVAAVMPPADTTPQPVIPQTPPVPVVEYDILPEIPRDVDEPTQMDVLVVSLRALVEQEKIFLQAGIRIDEVAMALGTNRTYLAKLMKEVYGHTFTEYMNLCRMKSAEIDLVRRKDVSIENIALTNGFNSSNTFNKVFCQYHDCTPAVWRKKHTVQ